MAVTIEEYQRLKAEHEAAERAAAKAEGALAQAMARLEEEFGVSSIEAAEAKLAEMQKEAEEAEEKYRKELDDFKEKWKGRV